MVKLWEGDFPASPQSPSKSYLVVSLVVSALRARPREKLVEFKKVLKFAPASEAAAHLPFLHGLMLRRNNLLEETDLRCNQDYIYITVYDFSL